MSFTSDLQAQLDAIAAAQAETLTQNATIDAEIKGLISSIGAVPGISAADAQALIDQATKIAAASVAINTALGVTAADGVQAAPAAAPATPAV